MHVLDELVAVTRELGDPARELAILAEGNTSIDTGEGRFWLKGSGVQMRHATAPDFVEMRSDALLDLAHGDPLTEAQLKEAIAAAVVRGARRPSIEAILHAICIQRYHATCVVHTHPVAVNRILTSSRSRELAGGVLFPDQAVVLGPETAYVSYASPGILLAQAVVGTLDRFVLEKREQPRTVWLENHGLLALGDSAADALAITTMASKYASILFGALAIGEPRYLDALEARSLTERDDERERRELLRIERYPSAQHDE